MRFLFIVFIVLLAISTTTADLTPQQYTNKVPDTFFTLLEFKDVTPFNRDSFELWDQSVEWQSEMTALGKRFTAAKVRSIYFVHGTFAGNDPFGIISCIKVVCPNLDPLIEEQLRKLMKKNNDKILRDTGNYLPEYVSLVEKACGGKIPCHMFNWSSRNHHIARLRGAAKLAKTIAKNHSQLSAQERVLLVGHSHGGQLFSVLTNLLSQSSGSDLLYRILEEDGQSAQELKDALAKIRHIKLDFVTFGTPPRYGWGDGFRIVNVINHRRKDHLAGSILGLLTTRDGDYIQKLGIAGTDVIASTEEERNLNRRLDQILGAGKDFSVWLDNVMPKMRVPEYGRTFLVDYKDGNKIIPNAISSFFGHGVYTKFDTMLFNTKLIVKELYR